MADGTPNIEKINFVGHRHLIDRMLAGGMLPRGSAIGFISSAAGLGWESSWEQVKEYLATPDFESASAWAIEHGWADYFHSKQAVCAYVARQAFPLLKQGIRINAICPGPTDTPLAQANEEMWLGFGADYREEAGIEASTPLEQAYPLVFLCSDAAAAITGQTLITDVGYVSSGVTESYPPGHRRRRLPARPDVARGGRAAASDLRREPMTTTAGGRGRRRRTAPCPQRPGLGVTRSGDDPDALEGSAPVVPEMHVPGHRAPAHLHPGGLGRRGGRTPGRLHDPSARPGHPRARRPPLRRPPGLGHRHRGRPGREGRPLRLRGQRRLHGRGRRADRVRGLSPSCPRPTSG